MTFMSRRRLLGFAASLALPIQLLRGRKSRAEAAPAAKTISFNMAEFTGKSKDADAAFAQALTTVGTALADAKKHGEAARAVLNLGKNAVYRIKQPIQLAQLDAFEINGQGAELVNTTLQSTLHIQSCNRVTIRDLSVDYDPLPYTQGTIAAFDAKALHITVKVDRGYPDDAKFLATIRDATFGVMDRRTRSLKPGARNFISTNKVERLGDWLIKVELAWSANDCGPGQLPVAAGDAVAICAGSAHAIVLENSAATSFVGLVLHASPGMGILENGGPGGTTLQRVVVAPGPKPAGATADRLVCTNSDGSHFIAVERGPSIDDCTFSNTNDDAVNVHGFYVFVLEKTGVRRYRVSPKWHRPGDGRRGRELRAGELSLARTHKTHAAHKKEGPRAHGQDRATVKGQEPDHRPRPGLRDRTRGRFAAQDRRCADVAEPDRRRHHGEKLQLPCVRPGDGQSPRFPDREQPVLLLLRGRGQRRQRYRFLGRVGVCEKPHDPEQSLESLQCGGEQPVRGQRRAGNDLCRHDASGERKRISKEL
jgi:hypothetical protein